jgi:hypothetical protein
MSARRLVLHVVLAMLGFALGYAGNEMRHARHQAQVTTDKGAR